LDLSNLTSELQQLDNDKISKPLNENDNLKMSKRDFESSQNLVRTFFKTRSSRAIYETLFWLNTFCKIINCLKKILQENSIQKRKT